VDPTFTIHGPNALQCGATLYSRRAFIQTGAMAAGAVALGPGFWRNALAAPATPGPGPYGPPVGSPNEFGLTLPQGFSSRLIAKGGAPVLGTTYDFPIFPDGAATYPLSDGGWILAVNTENPIPGAGGASAIRLGPDGSVRDAYRILRGTTTNCAGGKTPWGTWMSCEETDDGHVWECDPTGEKPAIEHPAMGTFKHEAIAVDPDGKRIYLTEDQGDGGFYRFTPTNYPDCSSGVLDIAFVDVNGVVHWNRVPNPGSTDPPTRKQTGMTEFKRGEGIWFDSGIVYVATTSDNKIHAYDPLTETIEVVYDQKVGDGPLNGVDNVTAAPSGDIYVAEDNGTNQIDIGIITPEGEVARFITGTGPQHEQSEFTGVCFDPSGKRMYFSSQRSLGGPGALFEISGPFRERQPAVPVGGGLRLRAHAGRTGTIDKFRRGGAVAIEITSSRSVIAKVSLRATIGGKPVTLAKANVELRAGMPARVRLKATKSGRERLRGRASVAAQFVATAKHAATGSSDTLVRDIRFVTKK
jgi:secreted PhoX family phosphatase